MRNKRLVRFVVATIVATATAAVTGAAPAHADVVATDVSAMVVSTQENADGTIDETTYTPADGVLATDLAQRLTSSGVTGVSVRSDGDVSAQAAACASGTARTWPSSQTCFARWAYSGAARPIIDFVDHTSASWPVGRAVTEWNKTSGIDSIYRTASAGCDGAPAHCVAVYSGNYGNVGWVGLTSRTLNAAQTYYTHASVKLNDYYGGPTEALHWNPACHELGHVLGLGHNTSTSSCLYYMQGSHKYPSTDDYNLLERYY